jgi:toxin ParE1/3/4
MAYRVSITNRAKRDLKLIYRYIHAADSAMADAWFNGLEKAVYSLEKQPNRCPATPENKKLRHLLYGHKPHVYRIIFRVTERHAHVTVLHVRHGAREQLS